MTMQRRYRRGDTGPAVAEIRSKLVLLGLLPAGAHAVHGTGDTDGHGGYADAVFDDSVDLAVRHFQQQRAMTVDGVVGPETYRHLDEARWRLGDRMLSYSIGHPTVGDDVATLQQRLLDMGFDCGRVDGILGPATERALREFQRNYGLGADGTCGPATFEPSTGSRARSSAANRTRCASPNCCTAPAPRWPARPWSSTRATAARIRA